jgi:hypothetical protein
VGVAVSVPVFVHTFAQFLAATASFATHDSLGHAALADSAVRPVTSLTNIPFASLLQNVLSGLVGALFASWDARARRHHTALVRLERRFNEGLNTLADNQLHVRGILASTKMGAVHWSWPSAVAVDATAYDDLVNLTLINELMSFNSFVEKVNHDAANLRVGYGQMTSGLMSGAITLDNFRAEARKTAEKVALLGKAYRHIEQESKRLLCCARILARKDLPLTGRIVLLFVRSEMPKMEDIAVERGKLDAEIAATRSESGAEIQRVLGNAVDLEGTDN